MIESISSNNTMMRPEPKPLTDEQKNTLNDILSNYDADNLSAGDAKAIAEQLKEAGINPGPGLGKSMSDLGFDAKEIGKLAGAPPPPKPMDNAEQSGISVKV
ncbi:hypothetical protein LJ739_19020 [Aestuariibacter halophilus]|uniref:Uncharacterized protein n=1 Tax=Fluctibacter halophilus TaxID=226011 RepID=A0ABS8GCX7_9ALTE|nr:hypothetical protein [Aestuariibacter halophilus]MCC2618353.1 hypothetical protein [Aestuariibacter halophilus]